MMFVFHFFFQTAR